MNISNPSKTYSLDDFIKEGLNEEINSYIITYVKMMEGCIIPIYNIWNKYSDLLMLPENSISMVFTDAEFHEYIYKPKKLSLKLYNTIALDHLLLFLNKWVSVTQFNQQRIKVFHPKKTRLLSEIIINEEAYLRRNKLNNKYAGD